MELTNEQIYFATLVYTLTHGETKISELRMRIIDKIIEPHIVRASIVKTPQISALINSFSLMSHKELFKTICEVIDKLPEIERLRILHDCDTAKLLWGWYTSKNNPTKYKIESSLMETSLNNIKNIITVDEEVLDNYIEFRTFKDSRGVSWEEICKIKYSDDENTTTTLDTSAEFEKKVLYALNYYKNVNKTIKYLKNTTNIKEQDAKQWVESVAHKHNLKF